MKTFFKQPLKILWISRIHYFIILILIGYSCGKEKDPEIDFVFNTNEIVYYPDKHISITFDIKPTEDIGAYSINWYNPDTITGVGPFEISITSNLILDFEIADQKNRVKRFQYEINADAIDSVSNDYRNNYIGTYYCQVASSYQGSTTNYLDTLTVVKNIAFNKLNILTSDDLTNKYEGNSMTYHNSNGFNTSPAGAFFGYHSGALFSKDSLHYVRSGPLGYYYTKTYEGIRINK